MVWITWSRIEAFSFDVNHIYNHSFVTWDLTIVSEVVIYIVGLINKHFSQNLVTIFADYF